MQAARNGKRIQKGMLRILLEFINFREIFMKKTSYRFVKAAAVVIRVK